MNLTTNRDMELSSRIRSATTDPYTLPQGDRFDRDQNLGSKRHIDRQKHGAGAIGPPGFTAA
jgi:hypothetical protein